jgi:putative PIN family toxin of toxin-antitoxin system
MPFWPEWPHTERGNSLMRILLDTNVVISALLFGGKPRTILLNIIKKQYIGVTSPVLLSELADVLRKKFSFSKEAVVGVDTQMRKQCIIVSPKETIDVVADVPDNRVLEAAVEGKCDFLITGDADLLTLESYHKIRIFTPDEFLQETAD